MVDTNLPRIMIYSSFTKALETMKKLYSLALYELNGVVNTRDENWAGATPYFFNHLRVWGEASTAKVKN